MELRHDWRLVDEHWYEFVINGAKAGWMSEMIYESDEAYRTVVDSNLEIRRGSQRLRVMSQTQFVETRDGRPVEVSSRQTQSAQTVRTNWVFHDDHVAQSVHQGGRETKRELPRPEGVWLTPLAADRFARQRREAGADEYSYRTLDPDNGLTPMTVRSVRAGTSTYAFGDREIPVEVWTTTTDVLPLEITEHFSSDGHLMYQRIPMLGGTMEFRVVEREQALRVAESAPELLVQTFVRPDRPIDRVTTLRRARLRLRAQNGRMPSLPSAGAQKATVVDEATVLLEVDVDRHVATDVQERPEYLEPSAMVGSDDPLVQKLARSAARRAGDDALKKSEAMRRRVYGHITRKELETAFASASETAAQRRGDCSEHAVLLCAMLRAEGIPSRVASGLIYVDQFADQVSSYGWHMWTQALVGGRWIDLDATMPERYHAGHVLVSTAALADGSGASDLAAMIMLMGNLEIEVLELGYERLEPTTSSGSELP
jgi:transglutaminase-like putative cysteine protease